MRSSPRSRCRAAGGVVLLGAALLAFGEWQSWRASRDDYPSAPTRGPGRDVVLVLGFRSPRAGGTNAVQRWRTRIAARSAVGPGTLFVFSGGAVRATRPEAEVMAEYGIRRLGIPPGDVALETRARSTRENLAFARPWLRDAATIRIASNAHHARRARRYLRETEPELWARLVPTRDHVLFEIGPLRLALTFYEWVAGRVAARDDIRDPAATAADEGET